MNGHFENGVWIEQKIVAEIWRYHSKEDEIVLDSYEEALSLFDNSDNCALYFSVDGKDVDIIEISKRALAERSK